MKAILMAAGKGTRISRIVQKPKCTLEVNNSTIIGHNVDLLNDAGIDVSVVVGYRKEDVFTALKDRKATYYYNPFYSVTNSLGSLWFAKDCFDCKEDIIMANADTYFEQPLLDTILSDDHDYMMLGDKSRVKKGDYFFNVSSDGYLQEFGKELTLEHRNCEYVGFGKIKCTQNQIFKKRLCELVDFGKYDLWWENTMYEYLSKSPVFIKDVSELFWAEVDFYEDYERIMKYIDGTGWK